MPEWCRRWHGVLVVSAWVLRCRRDRMVRRVGVAVCCALGTSHFGVSWVGLCGVRLMRPTSRCRGSGFVMCAWHVPLRDVVLVCVLSRRDLLSCRALPCRCLCRAGCCRAFLGCCVCVVFLRLFACFVLVFVLLCVLTCVCVAPESCCHDGVTVLSACLTHPTARCWCRCCLRSCCSSASCLRSRGTRLCSFHAGAVLLPGA